MIVLGISIVVKQRVYFRRNTVLSRVNSYDETITYFEKTITDVEETTKKGDETGPIRKTDTEPPDAIWWSLPAKYWPT